MKNFWENTRGKKRFYKIPLFWIACAAATALIFAGGNFLGKKGKKPEDKIISEVPEFSKTVSPLVSVSPTATATAKPIDNAVQERVNFNGWSEFEEASLNLKLYYPPNWFAGKADGERMIFVHTADDKYYLYFGLREKGKKDEIQIKSGLPSGDYVKEGKITIAGTSVDRYKIVQDGKAKAYLYPKDIAQSKDGRWEFAAVFVSDNSKVDLTKADFELLDERAIGEKILKSIEVGSDVL